MSVAASEMGVPHIRVHGLCALRLAPQTRGWGRGCGRLRAAQGACELAELAFFAQQAMREHSMLGCKVLGICCARLPRQASGTAAAARGGGRGRARQQGQAREGRVGGEERGVPLCCGILGLT